MTYDFWPRGDDTYSRSARLNTVLAFAGTVLWLVFVMFCICILRRLCSC